MLEKKEFRPEIEKRFAKDFLDIFVLRLIRGKPRWGYELITEIRNRYRIKIGQSTIYPLLKSLENSGLIWGRWESYGKKKRKVYEITPEGIELIDSYNDYLKEQLQTSKVNEIQTSNS